MSTIEDFENAPVGATATHRDGSRAMKMDDIERRWVTSNGVHLNDREVEIRGYSLDPLWAAPESAREALALAWELAHEVKPGQSVPKGTRYLRLYNGETQIYIASCDFKVELEEMPLFRTFDPLPDPEPDWLDAPAVIAVCGYCEKKALHGPFEGRSRWECAECQITTTWRALTDVTPLYPKGQDA